MATPDEKTITPAYVSFKTLGSFFNDMRELGHIPSQVDKSMMPKFSGSVKGETMAALRFLGIINGDKGAPDAELFQSLVMAPDTDRKKAWEGVLRSSYDFLFNTPGFDLERASSQQVAELFRQRGVNGSTLTRAVAFFLSAAKEAGIKVSALVKAPPAVKNGTTRPKKDKEKEAAEEDVQPPPRSPHHHQYQDDVHKFELPIPGKPSVIVLIPKSLDGEDWDMFKDMFTLYVKRWKGFKDKEEKGAKEENQS